MRARRIAWIAWTTRIAISRAPLLLAALGGCRSAPTSAPTFPAPPAPSPLEGLVTRGGAWRVAWSATPASIAPGEPFTLVVEVQSTHGAAADPTGAGRVTLAIDATMPAHGHGMNVVPELRPLGDGRFQVEGLVWHMPGLWELTFDVTAGGVTERAAVNVTLD